MTPFTVVTGQAVALPLDNIDTDQLIPARFMKRSRSEGYGDYLLYDMRFDEKGQLKQNFLLNQIPISVTALVAGENFGCGSSREAAVYALMDYGFRVVIAKSFADIFRNNAAHNGLMTIVLKEEDHAALIQHIALRPGVEILINLEGQSVAAKGVNEFYFDIDPTVKRRLLLGVDALSETLTDLPSILRFEKLYFGNYPWIKPKSAA